ncbi:hypothetical protein [Thermogemmatispora onikobensis]|nr:hypothetical protein [Thermogemmatispora onikobensis]
MITILAQSQLIISSHAPYRKVQPSLKLSKSGGAKRRSPPGLLRRQH